MKKKIMKFLPLAIVLALSAVSAVFYPEIGLSLLQFSLKSLFNFLFLLIPVFICVGLLDVWVSREKMLSLMGKEAGVKGTLLAFLLGVITAVPLYALLPIAGVMLKKRCNIFNVLIFICSSASIRIPLLLFEASSFGWKFTLARFLANVVVVIAVSYIISKILTDSDKEAINKNADNL